MEQNQSITLEGKKKFIVTLCSIAASLVSLFLAPDTADSVVQGIMVAGPIVLGLLYDFLQSRIDMKKKEVELKREERFIIEAQLQPQAPTADSYAQAAPADPTPFNVEEFHSQVLNEVAEKYHEANPATIFYLARDKGQVTPCTTITQAQDYWEYLLILAKEACTWLEEKSKEQGPCSKQFPAYYAMNKEFSRVFQKKTDLDYLANNMVNWSAKLGPQHHTLYHLGELAYLMSGRGK